MRSFQQIFRTMMVFISFAGVLPASADGVHTKAKASRAPVDPNHTLVLNYVNPQFNQDPTKIETVTVYLKDASTNHFAEIKLLETAPDSSEFSGTYVVTWARLDQIRPEIYILNSKPTAQPPELQQVINLIKAGKIQRKPFVFHKEEGTQTLDTYDTSEAAQAALESFKPDPSNSGVRKANEKVPALAAIETSDMAKLRDEHKREVLETQKREAQRAAMKRDEKEKQDLRLEKFNALTPKEKENQKLVASQYAEGALDLYRVNNFKEAEANFAKSVEKDPSNTTYAYQYGIALFRSEKFNESIVALQLLPAHGYNPLERDFYIALNHYKLNELDLAARDFDQIRKTKKEPLASSSAFYTGMIKFGQLKYDEAKVLFQETLDTSEDPKLDERAEDFIEKIERVKAFAQNKAKKYTVNLSTGIQYDSNVLLTPDSNGQQSAPTNKGDTRFSGGIGLQWRPIYEKNYEFSVKGRSDMIYSVHNDFENADPILHSIGAPFVYKGVLFEKGFRVEAKPGYEILYLDPLSTGTKSVYMNSPTFDLSNTLVMNEDWFSSVNFKYRNDQIPSSADQTANKYNIDINNILFFNKKKTQGLVIDGAYTQNAANGPTFRYLRFDLGLTYLTPLTQEIQLIGGVTYYNAKYVDDPALRSDDDLTFLGMLSQPINTWLSANLLGTYTINNSNNPSFNYTKYTIGLNFSAEFNF